MKNILIICYSFPPNPGIGGRRWAKFAKYFFRKGAGVKIITVKSGHRDSEWTKDVNGVKENITFIDSGYPSVLSINPKTVLDKIYYRLALIYVKLFAKGNFYDKSSLLKKKLISEVESSIILNHINYVIVTVAPFQHAFFIADIIEKYPDVKFIVDFRDPWTSNKTSYGFEGLSNERKKYEMCAERTVLYKFDYIVSVSHYMTDHFKTVYPDLNSNKFLTFENGYDKEDFPYRKNEVKTNQINIVFTGTLYHSADNAFRILKTKLSTFRAYPAACANLLWSFYGDVDEKKVKALNLPGSFKCYGKVSKEIALNAIVNADACLLFLTDDINYSFSTKFCEYVSFKKPIMVVANVSSPTGKYVDSNSIGIHIHEDFVEDRFFVFFKELETGFYNNFDISRFDVESIAEKYLSFINSLNE